MKRRHFFQLIAGAAMIPVLPRLAKAAPMIWADGIHCDSAGLQAMIDGLPVEFSDPSLAAKIGWFGKSLRLEGITFRITEAIRFGEAFSDAILFNADFVSTVSGPSLIVEDVCQNFRIMCTTVRSDGSDDFEAMRRNDANWFIAPPDAILFGVAVKHQS